MPGMEETSGPIIVMYGHTVQGLETGPQKERQLAVASSIQRHHLSPTTSLAVEAFRYFLGSPFLEDKI